jgi:hypothetical protein
MNIILFFLSLLTTSNSQLIDITVCSDNSCNTNCISWTANNNECSTCRNSDCSISNPSAMIKNMNSITFYTDKSCNANNILPGTTSNQITLDNNCHLLHATDMTIIGSYRAVNKSAIIGAIVSGLIILGIVICIICCCCYKRRQRNETAATAAPAEPQIQTDQYPNKQLEGYGYSMQQYPMQQYSVQQYPMQQYPMQQYPMQQYPMQQYANAQQPTYYPPPLQSNQPYQPYVTAPPPSAPPTAPLVNDYTPKNI